ncbi:cytochrome P450 [Actinosynnema sp. NPDC059797]
MSGLTALAQGLDLLTRPDWYRLLPGGADVHRVGDGVYAVTGNRTVRAALIHPAIVAEHPLKASARALGPNVLDADGPRHRAFRSLLAPILSAARIAEYRTELIPDLVESLVDDLVGVETDDFHGRFGHKVPYGIVSSILGVDPALEDRFHRLTRPLARLLDYPTEETPLTHASVAELLELVERQRRTGAEGGGSLLEVVERTRDRKGISLTDGEVRATAVLFFLAGTETSSALITSLVYCLGRLVFDLSELADPAAAAGFVDEVLRLYPPVRTIVRFAGDDLVLDGVEVPRHAAVLVSVAGANRDPRVFDNPDRFEFGRDNRQAMPFAAGAHACPGAHLAKAEFALLVARLVRRCAEVVVTRDGAGVTSQSFSHPTDFSVRFVPKEEAAQWTPR